MLEEEYCGKVCDVYVVGASKNIRSTKEERKRIDSKRSKFLGCNPNVCTNNRIIVDRTTTVKHSRIVSQCYTTRKSYGLYTRGY